MPVTVRLLVWALVSALTVTPVASAETIAGTATQWGLLGTWRLDCGTPAGSNDPGQTYVVRDGKLFHERAWGDRHDFSPVLSASVTNNGGLELLVKFESFKQTRQWTMIKGDDGRVRIVSNRNVDTDEYAVRDGKFTVNGSTTPWQTHCQ